MYKSEAEAFRAMSNDLANTPDGGPAHGMVIADNGNLAVIRGLSVRDWFAGMALQGVIARSATSPDKNNEAVAAYLSYQYADAMLAERAKAHDKSEFPLGDKRHD